MAGIREEPKIDIEEYEEIVGNWDHASVGEAVTDNRAVSIQEPTFSSMTHIERPALRPIEESFAEEGNELHRGVVKVVVVVVVVVVVA